MSGANWGGRPLQALAINGYNLSIVPGNTVVLPSGGGSGGPNPIFSTIQVEETGFISTITSNKITTGELHADTIGSDSILVSSLNAYSELIAKNAHISSVVFEGNFDVSGPVANMKNISTGTIRATDITVDGDLTVLPGLTHDFKLGTDALNPIGDMKVFATNVALYSENPLDIMTFASAGDSRIAAVGSLDMYGSDINLYQTSISNILNINGLGAVAVTAGLGATLTAGGAVFIQAGGIATLTAGGDIEIGAASGFGTSIENLRIVDNIIHKTSGSANLEFNNVRKIVNEDSVSGAGGLEITAKEALNISSLTGNVNVKAPSGYVEVQGTAFIGNTIGSVGVSNDVDLIPSSGKVSVEHDLGARNIYTSTITSDDANFSTIQVGRVDVSSALVSTLTVPPLTIRKGANIGANYSTLDFANAIDLSHNGGIRVATLAFNAGRDVSNDVFTFVDASFNPTYWLQAQGPKKIAFQQSDLLTEFYSTTTTHGSATFLDVNEGRFETLQALAPQTFVEVVDDLQMGVGAVIRSENIENSQTITIGNGLTYTPTVRAPLQVADTFAGSMAGLTVQNKSSAANASGNIYISNNGATETSDYAVLGLNGTNYNSGANLISEKAKGLYLGNSDGDISLLPNFLAASGGNTHIGWGGNEYAFSITSNGGISLNTTYDVSNQTYNYTTGNFGNLLMSGGSGGPATWSDTLSIDSLSAQRIYGVSTTVDQLNFRQFTNPGLADAHMYVDTLDGVAPAIITCDSNFANGANFAIVGPVGAGQFPALAFFDPNNGFQGAGLSFRYAPNNQAVIRTGVGFENYNFSRVVRRINEGLPEIRMVAQNYPSAGQFTSTAIAYDAPNSLLQFKGTSLSLEAPSGQQAFIAMTSGANTAAITYESPSTSPFNRFYFGGAGLSASDFMSLDSLSFPYIQLFDISYTNLGKWEWDGANEYNTFNRNLIIGKDYYGTTPYFGISDGTGGGNIAKMTFNVPSNKLEFNKSIDTSNNDVYTNTLYASTIQAPVSITDKGSVDTTLTINNSGWSGSLIFSVPYTFPYDVAHNPIYALTIGIQGHTNFGGNLGFFVAIHNYTTGTDISGWNFQNNNECVSQATTFGTKDAHSPTWTEYFNLAGLMSQGNSFAVEVGVQANSGSGTFSQGSFVWTLAPVKQLT